MCRPVTPDQLASEIQKILDVYSDDLNDNIGEAMQKVGRKGVQMLQSTSPKAEKSPYSGTYAKGWKLSVENHRNLTHEAVIYNIHAGLPHLLEHGHLLRNGKRSKEQEHIAPVEKTLIEEFVEEVAP